MEHSVVDIEARVTHNQTRHIPRLKVTELTVGYGTKAIVSDVTIEALPGEVTVLVGPNGCGKSTLLKAMARVLQPMTGQATLDDAPVHTTPTRKLACKLALLPQGPVAPEGLTVHELVSQGRFPHQTLTQQWSAEDSRAVDAALEAADVAQFAERRVDSLSGGQRQRCWIAMVLAQETDVILLDEPTTFLDLKVQVDVMTLLRKIAHEQGRTLVVVLHELNIAAMFADQIIMMRGGALIARGAPERVITRENLRLVFDLDAHVIADPITGRPVCLPVMSGSSS
ncbi:ABC transporter ATP-binding protein [Roseobacter sp. CCS2]|uniref:ABC transporter ATP-binding protein n=1 Tax=Roseobacter sp. CCS2 TaxID=391593 RepID=UPI0000F402BA|nr:ABC transporter ATP-binding protein [Roseobacter sp. CCS2]EBA13654.1 ABC-type cobalamin/Fe3+-siderophores transport system, ATPase components [Roseobacter sp. CCS2]